MLCSENHSGHRITCGIVVMKITHWSNSGFSHDQFYDSLAGLYPDVMAATQRVQKRLLQENYSNSTPGVKNIT